MQNKYIKSNWKIFPLSLSLFIALGCCATLSTQAKADDTTDAGSSVARISVLHGNVTMQRGDSGDTVAASINAPVNVGDYLSTPAGDSRAEVQLDANDFVRVGANSQLRFTQLDANNETLQLAAGTIELRMFKYVADPQVDTPSISIRPNVAGQYRVSVASDGSTTFTVRSGSADLLAPQGRQTIGAGLTVVVSGTSSNPVIRPVAVVAYDDFDSWNAQRDQYAQQAYSDQYINPDMVGADDLNADGHWVWEPDYGNVWVPYGVAPGWAPYHDGRWAWEPYYGWTRVGYEPDGVGRPTTMVAGCTPVATGGLGILVPRTFAPCTGQRWLRSSVSAAVDQASASPLARLAGCRLRHTNPSIHGGVRRSLIARLSTSPT